MKKILDIEKVLHNLVQKKIWKKSFFHIVKNIQSPLKKKKLTAMICHHDFGKKLKNSKYYEKNPRYRKSPA